MSGLIDPKSRYGRSVLGGVLKTLEYLRILENAAVEFWKTRARPIPGSEWECGNYGYTLGHNGCYCSAWPGCDRGPDEPVCPWLIGGRRGMEKAKFIRCTRTGKRMMGGEAKVYLGDTQDPLPHDVRHSPTGFEWGYAGSGPAELARCILLYWFGDDSKADVERFYQKFKFEFIATMPEEGRDIPYYEAWTWLATQQAKAQAKEARERAEEGADRGQA